VVFALSRAAEKTTTVRLDARTLKRIDGLARAASRSRSWVVNQALERYLEYEEWFAEEVAKGIKDAEAGGVLDHGSLVKTWERKRAAKSGLTPLAAISSWSNRPRRP
jgi:predicted transcriptional regulator